MDRGFVFKMVNNYISMFSSGDPKVRTTFRSDGFLNYCITNKYTGLCV